MPNPNPKITPEFEAKKFRPVSDLPEEPLAKLPIAVKLPRSVDDKIRSLPQKERIEWLRQVISDAAKNL